jgi:hypothetical protein
LLPGRFLHLHTHMPLAPAEQGRAQRLQRCHGSLGEIRTTSARREIFGFWTQTRCRGCCPSRQMHANRLYDQAFATRVRTHCCCEATVWRNHDLASGDHLSLYGIHPMHALPRKHFGGFGRTTWRFEDARGVLSLAVNHNSPSPRTSCARARTINSTGCYRCSPAMRTLCERRRAGFAPSRQAVSIGGTKAQGLKRKPSTCMKNRRANSCLQLRRGSIG